MNKVRSFFTMTESTVSDWSIPSEMVKSGTLFGSVSFKNSAPFKIPLPRKKAVGRIDMKIKKNTYWIVFPIP